MSRSIVFAIFLIANIFGSSCVARLPEIETDDSSVQVFYLPFKYETFSPVTKLTIRSEANCRMHVPSVKLRDFFSEARGRSKTGTFDDKVVRVEMFGALFKTNVNTRLFVDQDGGLSEKDQDLRSLLQQDDVRKLDDMLAHWASDRGCKTY